MVIIQFNNIFIYRNITSKLLKTTNSIDLDMSSGSIDLEKSDKKMIRAPVPMVLDMKKTCSTEVP